MKTNQEYKNAALASLKGNWAQAIVATFAVLLLSVMANFIVFGSEYMMERGVFGAEPWVPYVVYGSVVLLSLLFFFFLAYPLILAYINSFSRLYYKSDREILLNLKETVFEDALRGSAGMFVMGLVTSLCSLALFVPGIIASLSLFLTPYLLKDYPELTIMETLRLSRKMMKGHKMQLFMLQLSFIGWILLNVLTLGLGSLWLTPYMMTTLAAFYHDVREQYIMKEGLQGSAL
jgi:uncharacterized membrane protein